MLPTASGHPPAPLDPELDAVFDELRRADPDGTRMSRVFRQTFDQLYDGQRSGRFSWGELSKTERAHYGSLIEINLQREFQFDDGDRMDYTIAGQDIDCKYSQNARWMLPRECFGFLILGSVASDENSCFSIGLVRATSEHRSGGANIDGDESRRNQDKKEYLNPLGKSRIRWIFKDHPMPENILLQVSAEVRASIMANKTSGQARLDELFRLVQNRRIPRTTIETVGRQKDPMKRVRQNGGSRTNLRPEGFLLLGGDYDRPKALTAALGAVVPGPGEIVSIRVVPTGANGLGATFIDGRYWRMARIDEVTSDPSPEMGNQ